MIREVVLDTETTGLNYEDGHRLVEIGIIELENHIPTGDYFHFYLNPERDSDKRAEEIHGLSREFLSDKPKFSDIANEFISYLSDSKIIIHNASFDVGFINLELDRCGMKDIEESVIIDTLKLAKRKFIGQSVSLDALCRRYDIDLSGREFHGALKDAKLLASVYLELIGGRQSKLNFENPGDKVNHEEDHTLLDINEYYKESSVKNINNIPINHDDYLLHLKSINQIKKSIWKKISI